MRNDHYVAIVWVVARKRRPVGFGFFAFDHSCTLDDSPRI